MTRNTRITTIDLPFAVSAEHLDYLCQVMPIVDTQLRRVVVQLRAEGLDDRLTQSELSRRLQAFMRKAVPFAREEYIDFFATHITTALRQGVEQALVDMAIDLYAENLRHDDYKAVGNVVTMIANL